eukprot:TCONS_00052623-protein
MAENKGGYDVEFLHEQFDDMKCSICLLILREPMQADECGHRFCKSCVVNIEKSGQKKYICPQDRTKMTLFRDKGREREILNRPVKCIHHKEGCCWAKALRELEYHTKECDFEEMVCPFNDCGYKFQRRFLAKHNKEDCLYRTMLCPFCDEEYSFHLEQDHIEDCDYLPICCDYCQARDIPRYKMETHLIQKCAKAPRQCDFAHLGCEEQMLMYDIAKHNTNFSDHHINLALQKISAKENIIMEMGQDLERVQSYNINLRQDIEELRNDNVNLNKQVASQAEEIQRLKTDLQKAKSLNSDQNISKITGSTNKSSAFNAQWQAFNQRIANGQRQAAMTQSSASMAQTAAFAPIPTSSAESTSMLRRPFSLAQIPTRLNFTNFSRANKHTWRVHNFSVEVSKAIGMNSLMPISKSFYTSLGYRIKVDLYPNLNKFVAIYSATMVGCYDSNLKWPMEKSQLGLHVLGQEDGKQYVSSFHIETSTCQAFRKPPHLVVPFGCETFLSHNDFGKAINNDILTIVFDMVQQ